MLEKEIGSESQTEENTSNIAVPAALGSISQGSRAIGNTVNVIVDQAVNAVERPDYYLLNRPKRPKADIAKYVESHGISVPRRFSRLKEALDLPLRNCRRIILRSEHPQDYDGYSGDLPSWEIYRTDSGGFEVYGIFHTQDYSDAFYGGDYANACAITSDYLKSLQTACRKKGFDPEVATFSVWEKVPGDNYAVIADSGIPGRYHVYSDFRESHTHSVIDIGKKKTLPVHVELIREYEKIRHLERFDPKNCPVMEFQRGGEYPDSDIDYAGKNYFLQYLRTRDFMPANFSLKDYRLKKDEQEALLVRGITSPEGTVIHFGDLFYGSWGNADGQKDEGRFFQTCSSFDPAGIEAAASGKVETLCMIVADLTEMKYEGDVLGILEGHAPRSFFHKPKLSLVVSESSSRFFYESGGILKGRVKVHVVSDGKRAILKPIREQAD